MSKPLNGLMKTSRIAVPGALPVSSSTYEPSAPRVALALAGVAMTVITIAVSVILPAQLGSAGPEPRMLAASKVTAPAPLSLATVTRVDVVAARELRSSTAPGRVGEAASQPVRPGKTTSPALVRVLGTNH